MTAPDFLVIGHLVKDRVAEGWRLGGTASFASLTAHRLGLRTAVLSAAADDIDLGLLPSKINLRLLSSEETTVFENVYGPEGRTQYVWGRARPIEAADVPDDLREARIVLIGPVLGEVAEEVIRCFPRSLVAVTVQGWLRAVLPEGRVQAVSPRRWRPRLLLEHSRALFVSEEDLPPADTEETLKRWSSRVPMLFFTRSHRGARMWCHRRWRHVPAYPAQELDPTGAGDVFAAAFLARYVETDDAWQAALFAAAAASWSVEQEGLGGIPTRQQVMERLQRPALKEEEP